MLKSKNIYKLVYFIVGIAGTLIVMNAVMLSFVVIRNIIYSAKSENPAIVCANGKLADKDKMCIRKKILDVLLQVDNLPLVVKKHTAIYIPKNIDDYWGWAVGMRLPNVEQGYRCGRGASFYVQMLTGVAMIHGQLSKECYDLPGMRNILNAGLGYAMYEPKYDPRKEYAEKELCDYAIQKKFDQVLVLHYIQNKPTFKLIKCMR